MLVRRDRDSSGKEQWLLLHKNDEAAVPGWDPEDHPRSVKTRAHQRRGGRRPRGAVAQRPAGGRGVGGHRDDRPADVGAGPTEDELAALDALGKGGLWQLQGRELKLTNLDKVLFPAGADGRPVTKREVIRYYAQIAPWMLPYLYDRPLNLYRSPDGVDKPGFWHKEVPCHAPDWLRQWHNTEADPGETRCYAVVDSVPALAWMANYGGLELHAWTSRIPDVHQPTWALIDIDPGTTTTFDDILVLARLYRTALEHLHVVGMPKVTGKRGVQIWIPITPATPSPTRGAGSRRCPRPSATPSPRWSAGSGTRTAARAWPAWTTPRTPSTRRWWPRSAPGRRPAPRCRCPSGGTSSTTPTSAPTGGRCAPSSTAWPRPATPWPR